MSAATHAARQLLRVQWIRALDPQDAAGILRLVAMTDPDLFDESAAKFLRAEPAVGPRDPIKVIEMLWRIGPDIA